MTRPDFQRQRIFVPLWVWAKRAACSVVGHRPEGFVLTLWSDPSEMRQCTRCGEWVTEPGKGANAYPWDEVQMASIASGYLRSAPVEGPAGCATQKDRDARYDAFEALERALGYRRTVPHGDWIGPRWKTPDGQELPPRDEKVTADLWAMEKGLG